MVDIAAVLKQAIPTFSSYGHYKSKGYGQHCMLVRVATMDFYFSYQTCVAFRAPDTGLIVVKNSWGPTTGKHLKWIDGCTSKTGKHRLDDEVFDRKLYNALITNHLLKGKRVLTDEERLDDLAGCEDKAPDMQAGVPLLNPDSLIQVDDSDLI